MRIRHRQGWILLILLVAAVLRLVGFASVPPGMTGIPPGMTHDEADHGLTAWAIVNGARDLYFTVGYGREPIYDYATALVMAGTGPAIFAARLTSVYFSLVMIAAVYAWARRAFGPTTALLAAAGLAVGFWPVMAGRQALRSIALPAVFALAVVLFWKGLTDYRRETATGRWSLVVSRWSLVGGQRSAVAFAAAGLFLGLTFYTYIPARAMWLAFPALTIYLLLWGGLPTRRYKQRALAGLGLTLMVAALVAAPLLLYLAGNPNLEVRIDELSAPLKAAAGGDFALLWANARGALRLFTIEGDQTWRYNIPGKPWLGPVMGALFYGGLLVAGWLAVRGLRFRNRVWRTGVRRTGVRSEKLDFYDGSGPGAFLALIWLALGFAPVVVTGPGLSMTQAIGALPALYVFPALALVGGYRALVELTTDHRRQTTKKITNYELGITNKETTIDRRPPPADSKPLTIDQRPTTTDHSTPVTRRPWSVVCGLIAVALFATIAALTARDYFGRWANAPEVRVQYETAMVTALRYLDEQGRGAAAVSTITPDRYHTPAVAALTLHNPAVAPRWFDGRQSLLLPDDPNSTLIIPGFTPVPDALQAFLANAEFVEELPMRPDDLDRPLRVYRLDGPAGVTGALAMMTTTADGRPLTARFGEHIQFLGYQLAAQETRPGETLELVTAWRLLRPLPDASLFAHLSGPGEPLAVADSLGAPGESWVAGDVLLQLHAITIPDDAPVGAYPLVVGAYTQSDGRRLLTEQGEDAVTLTTVAVIHD
jgi:hypothetical protein